MTKLIMSVGVALATGCIAGTFNGLTADMASLCRLSDARSRSISPENFTGARNAGALADPVADKDKRNVANASGCARQDRARRDADARGHRGPWRDPAHLDDAH